MLILFVSVFVLIILSELIKGLSANGTPPLLQKFAWQMDLAYLMWSAIGSIRVIGFILLTIMALAMPAENRAAMLFWSIPLGILWGGVYWFFNRFWVGKYKFLPITKKVFLDKTANALPLDQQVIGVDLNGEQKAFPVPMLFYHHQITDAVGGKPIWATYCGLCRSGRIYDAELEGSGLEFGLVGAITFNAVFRDTRTGSWWRQETGEAAKGKLKGHVLDDIPSEQMSLGNWFEKHPQSTVLQYDPVFAKKYAFLTKLINYEASLPGWHRQETPPLIIGVEIDGYARAYDWGEVQKRRIVQDTLSDTPLMVLSDAEGSSGFVYDRRLQGEALEFELVENTLRDNKTGSEWDHLGRCITGKLQGNSLTQIQSYQQFLRAWISFHGHTDFYAF